MSKQETETTIRQFTDTIVEKFKPDKLILFGSHAWGTPGPDSDIDLFVIKETENTRELARKIDGALFPRYTPLDLIVYRPSDADQALVKGSLFVREIFSRGRVLYAK